MLALGRRREEMNRPEMSDLDKLAAVLDGATLRWCGIREEVDVMYLEGKLVIREFELPDHRLNDVVELPLNRGEIVREEKEDANHG